MNEQTCAECGSDGQSSRYCSECGALLKTQPTVPQVEVTPPVSEGSVFPLPQEPSARVKAGRIRRPKAVIAALAALVVVITGLMIAKTSISPVQNVQHIQHTLKGSLELSDAEGLSKYLPGETCSGSGGYADVTEAAQVTAFNEANVIVGTGRLSPGAMQGGLCLFSFTISKVPDSQIYQLEIGSESRGKKRYSRTDAENMGYQFDLSLGDGIPVPERPSCPVISDITAKVKMIGWEYMGDASVSGNVGDAGTSWAEYTLDIGNQSSLDVTVTGEVVASFANGKTESDMFTYTDAFGDGKGYVQAPTSWGKPKTLHVNLLDVTTDALCK